MPVPPRPLPPSLSQPLPARMVPAGTTRDAARRPAGVPVHTVAELRAAGVGRGRTRASDLVAVGWGLRAAATGPPDRLSLLRALVRSAPAGAVLSHATAAGLWGMWLPRRLESPLPVHIAVPPGAGPRPQRSDVVGHRLAVGAPVTSRAGLPVTAPAWTWTDLAGVLVPSGRPADVPPSLEAGALEALLVAGESLLQTPHGAAARSEPGGHPRCTLAQLEEAVGRRRNVRGVRLLRAALPLLREGSGSPAESRLRLRLVAAGFPEPRMNRVVVLDDGSWVMPDLVWEEARVCLEYEGDHHRTDAAQFRADVARVRRLEASGWRCLRVTADVWTDPGWRALTADLSRALGVRLRV